MSAIMPRVRWTAGLGKLVTTHVYPPIPDRRFDWCAYWDNDVECSSLYGWGPTEEAALADLAERIEEHNE